MRNSPSVNFSQHSGQLAATAQNFEIKISEHLLPSMFLETIL